MPVLKGLAVSFSYACLLLCAWGRCQRPGEMFPVTSNKFQQPQVIYRGGHLQGRKCSGSRIYLWQKESWSQDDITWAFKYSTLFPNSPSLLSCLPSNPLINIKLLIQISLAEIFWGGVVNISPCLLNTLVF